MIEQRERPFTHLRACESVVDYMYPEQLEMIEKCYKNPWLLIAIVDQALRKRKGITPIKSAYKYIIVVAQNRSWPIN